MSIANPNNPNNLSIYICTDQHGHYPVGFAAVVVAVSESQARALLKRAIKKEGLTPDEDIVLEKVELDVPKARVLVNGDY